jgi:CRP/FNR family cyclic AMP-dependent transcriptional regulator
LIDALAEQFVVGGDRRIAARLARKTATKTYQKAADLMLQGGEDTDLMFILGGQVQIRVNEREIAQRKAGEHVGEMALLDTHAVRSATVRALERTVVAVISEYDFGRIAGSTPILWRRLALTLAERLRERAKFHSVPRTLPAVFIGSSSEAVDLAECIYKSLKRNAVVPHLWTKGVFECSKTTIEELVREASESDFAVIVLSRDDVTTSRRRRKASPRDNVIFELGLFMGALSRERTILLVPDGPPLKLPTDLLGVTFLPYASKRGRRPGARVKEPLRSLRRHIEKYGPR